MKLKNVVCLSRRLLHIFGNIIDYCKCRLEQSDLGLHCLTIKAYITFQQTTKADNVYCDWPFKG